MSTATTPDKKPISFNFSDRIIEEIAAFCLSKSIKPAVFIGETVKEYAEDTDKLARAITVRILNAQVNSKKEKELCRSTTYRIPNEAVATLRQLAKSIDMTFDGLTRIIVEDKLHAQTLTSSLEAVLISPKPC